MDKDKLTKALELELQARIESEKKRQGEEIKIENSWWQDSVISDEKTALKDGRLVKVSVDNSNYCLIGPIRREEEPRSLTPLTLSLLNKIGSVWSAKIKDKFPDDEVRLSVSSLYRTIESLEERIRLGLAVAEIGPHQAGTAIDFDPNGYYFGEERRAVNRSKPDFNEGYIKTLKETLVDLEKNGDCHVIWEKGYKIKDDRVVESDACWHVCLNPNFKNEKN